MKPSRRRRLVPGSPTRRTAVIEPKREGLVERSDTEKELEQDLAWAWINAGIVADRGCE